MRYRSEAESTRFDLIRCALVALGRLCESFLDGKFLRGRVASARFGLLPFPRRLFA